MKKKKPAQRARGFNHHTAATHGRRGGTAPHIKRKAPQRKKPRTSQR